MADDIQQKLAKLQLTPELEYALQKEFPPLNEEDELGAANFNVVDYLNAHYGTEEDLQDLPAKIQHLDQQVEKYDTEIKDCVRSQAYASERARDALRQVNEEAARLVERIASVKQKAEQSENMVKDVCSEIRQLDYAKKNITFMMISLKRLIMLITGIEQLREFCIEKRYKDAANLIEATAELTSYFADYKDTVP